MYGLNKSYKIICSNCGTPVVRSNRVETCSMKCRGELRLKNLIEANPANECPVCGEQKNLIYRARKIRVCSSKCASTIHGRYHHKLRQLLPPRSNNFPCAQCETPFKQQRSANRFCSSSCHDKWRHFHFKKTAISEKREMRYRAMSPCVLCKVTYDRIRTAKSLGSNMHPQKFCWDHIHPRSHGGDDHESNKRSLCWFCNTARRDISPDHDAAIAAAGKAFWSALET